MSGGMLSHLGFAFPKTIGGEDFECLHCMARVMPKEMKIILNIKTNENQRINYLEGL
jgi:hypothetical protein